MTTKRLSSSASAMAIAAVSFLVCILSQPATCSPETFYRLRTHIDLPESPVYPSQVLIEIHNPKPPKDTWYSVTVVSENRYSGVAALLGRAPRPSASTDAPNEPLLYSWTPPFSGKYQVIVHELPQEPVGRVVTVPFPTEYFDVTNKPGFLGPWGLIIDRMKMLPPCQNVNRMDVYTAWDGSWIGPGMVSPEGTLRNGWFFLPSEQMDCKIETFHEEDFKLVHDERGIYILGNSKERGIFLSLVDILLDDEEKKEIEESVISKCWGRASVQKYNLKVMYQDWRSDNFDTRSNIPTVVCHNEKVAREGGPLFFDSGMRVWDEIFRGERATWPSVILMSTGNDIFGFERKTYDINQFVMRLPPDWRGTLFLTDGAFSARLAGRGYESDYEAYRARLNELTAITNDPRVRWLDGMGLSKEMRMYGEKGPEQTTISQHFHTAACNLPYRDANGNIKSMRICSNVTENIAQLLIGHALGSKAALRAKANELPPNSIRAPTQVMQCHNCPADLLPFHITPYPEMSCSVGPLHALASNEMAGEPQTCPEQCMQVEVKRKFGSQTDQIYERHCPYEFFPEGFQVGNQAIKKTRHIDDNIGFAGHLVWLFNVILLFTLLGYQHRAKLRSHVVKFLDPTRSNV
ncbi:hypothetical protein ACHAW6_015764 [Cyclotella cf. meneghiniana]